MNFLLVVVVAVEVFCIPPPPVSSYDSLLPLKSEVDDEEDAEAGNTAGGTLLEDNVSGMVLVVRLRCCSSSQERWWNCNCFRCNVVDEFHKLRCRAFAVFVFCCFVEQLGCCTCFCFRMKSCRDEKWVGVVGWRYIYILADLFLWY